MNGVAGLTHKLTPNFLVGMLGGYEGFAYTSEAFDGVLKGTGRTTGTCLGWRLMRNLRFDVGGAWSEIFTNDAARMVSGNFIGRVAARAVECTRDQG